jgi:hypothetical protein
LTPKHQNNSKIQKNINLSKNNLNFNKKQVQSQFETNTKTTHDAIDFVKTQFNFLKKL